MNQKRNFAIFISCILFYGLVLSSCAGSPSLVPSLAPTFSQTPSPTRTNVPSATAAIPATPTVNNKTVILTPEDVFSLPGLKALSTPNSEDFCEHLPPPQISSNANESSTLSGRFLLCPSRSRPWVNTAIDLDRGILVSVDNESADIVMEYAHVPIDGTISYYVIGLNKGHIDEIATNTLSYGYCKNLLVSLNRNDSGILAVHDGAIACMMTMEDRIAVIRVEKIYALETQAVEFSFAVLRK